MKDPKLCNHERLYFGSGDYYVICRECNAYWMRKAAGSQPEYGYDHQGRRIGAAPNESNGMYVTPGDRSIAKTIG